MKFLMLLLAGLFACASAHPHMFIDTEMEVRLNQDMLVGIEITWYFDPMFTAAITADFDRNGNGQFSPGETGEVYANAFSNLHSSDYFTFLTIDDHTLSPGAIEEFSVFLDESTLVYSFFCPFNTPVPGGELRVAIYDRTYYCDILYREGSPITLTGPGSENAEFEIQQNDDIAISYGGTVSVSRDGSTYSGTAYPQQLVVYLNSDRP
ncbi:MAG: DUF1007 family protein [Candidatus Sabulitectum sp.]|nr:DUF1007 family protein [Candidatus Sabulitectum sp.]